MTHHSGQNNADGLWFHYSGPLVWRAYYIEEFSLSNGASTDILLTTERQPAVCLKSNDGEGLLILYKRLVKVGEIIFVLFDGFVLSSPGKMEREV